MKNYLFPIIYSSNASSVDLNTGNISLEALIQSAIKEKRFISTSCIINSIDLKYVQYDNVSMCLQYNLKC